MYFPLGFLVKFWQNLHYCHFENYSDNIYIIINLHLWKFGQGHQNFISFSPNTLIRFWSAWPSFQDHHITQTIIRSFSSPLSHDPTDAFLLNSTLFCWTWIYPAFANSVDPDQLASSEANWSGSALFNIKYVCLCWGLTAQSTQWGHVERGQFT